MKGYRRAFALLLALMVLWGALPAGMTPVTPVAAADNPNIIEISNGNDWDAFAQRSWGSLPSGTTVTLIQDITLPQGVRKRALLKEGVTFDGNGKKITLQNVQFKSDLENESGDGMMRDSIGLFDEVNGTLKNVVLKLNGPLEIYSKALMNGPFTWVKKYAGALAGSVNGGTVENCAVIAEDPQAVVQFSRNDWALFFDNNSIPVSRSQEFSLGGMFGRVDGGKISNCFSNAPVAGLDGFAAGWKEEIRGSFWQNPVFSNAYRVYMSPHAVGGLIGKAEGNTILDDCAFYGKNLSTANFFNYENESNGVGYNMGGLIGRGDSRVSVTACFVGDVSMKAEAPYITSSVTESMVKNWNGNPSGYPRTSANEASATRCPDVGSMAGDGKLGSVTSCYYSQISYHSASSWNGSGKKGIPTAEQMYTRDGTVANVTVKTWADTLYGSPNLSWLLKDSVRPKEVTVGFETVNGKDVATLQVKEPKPSATSAENWRFKLTFPAKSPMPTPYEPSIEPPADSSAGARLNLANEGEPTPAKATVYPGQTVTLTLQPPPSDNNAYFGKNWNISWNLPSDGSKGTMTSNGGTGLSWTYQAPSSISGDTLEVSLTGEGYPLELDSGQHGSKAAIQITVAKPRLCLKDRTLPEDQTKTIEDYRYQIGGSTNPEAYPSAGIPLNSAQTNTVEVWTSAEGSAYRTESNHLTYEVDFTKSPPLRLTKGEADAVIATLRDAVSLDEAVYDTASYPVGADTTKMNLDAFIATKEDKDSKEKSYARAPGQVKVEVYDVTQNIVWGRIVDHHKNLFREGVGGHETGGGSAPMPMIYPIGGQQIVEAVGITIEVQGFTDGDVIKYATQTNMAAAFAGPGGYPERSKFDDYSRGQKIDFPAGDNVVSFEVWAFTQSGKQGVGNSGVAYRRYENSGDLPNPDPPAVFLKGSDGLEKQYDGNGYYEAGSVILFRHPGFADGGKIRYSVGSGTDPMSAVYGRDYVDQDGKRPTIPENNNDTYTIRICFIDKHGKVSEPFTAVLRISPTLDAPQPNPPSGSSIKSGQAVTLTLSDATLRKLDPNFGTGNAIVARVYYGEDGQLHGISNGQLVSPPPSIFQDNAPNVSVNPNSPPVPGTEYISVLFTDDYLIPNIRYLLGDGGTVNLESLQCNYGIRKVTAGFDGGNAVYNVSYEQPTPIFMTGSPGETVTLQAITRSMNPNMASSGPAKYNYQILPKTAAPKAAPDTNQDKVYVMRPDGRITLSCTTAGARLYYTDDDTMPAMNADGSPAGTTKLYDADAGIPMNKDALTFYTIRAFAVAAGYDQSDTVMFPYQLPAQVQAVMANPGEGEVEKGTKVALSCSTDGATIYYTTDGSEPEPYKSPAYKNAIEVNEDLTITAVAELNGMTSAATEYNYELAGELSPPLASVPTGSIVAKGAQITLYAKRGSIAYTLDGSDPKELVEKSKKKDDSSSSSGSGGGGGVNVTVNNTQTEDDKVFYGTKATIDAKPGETVTLRAFCYETGYTSSEVAAFTYTVGEDGDYLMSIPPAESTVSPGDVITLSTGITGGRIFYTTGSDTPSVYNTYDNDRDNDDDGRNRRTHYYWEPEGMTQEGNIVTVDAAPGSIFTIRALVAADEAQAGGVQVLTYNVAQRMPAPTATIPSGAYVLKGAQTELTAKEGDIFYTTDGTDPTTSSRIYTEKIQVLGSMVLKAIAVAEGKQPSDIVQYVYTYAGQTAAPVMSVPGGEIAQGTQVALTSDTADASIYYSTDGSEPDTGSTLYTAPISVMRAVTLKARAFKKGLDDSVVNTATYTVNLPPEPPAAEETEGESRVTQTDRLLSRRTYSEDTGGPAFDDVMLMDASTNVILSAPAESLPQDAQLVVKPIEPAPHEQDTVRGELGNEIVSLFEVAIMRGGEPVQPTGQVELGLPIPPEAQNGLVTACRLLEDGTLAAYPTRRSGGVAYVLVDHFSKYAVTAPAKAITVMDLPLGAITALSVSVPAALVSAGVAIYLRKKKKSGGAS